MKALFILLISSLCCLAQSPPQDSITNYVNYMVNYTFTNLGNANKQDATNAAMAVSYYTNFYQYSNSVVRSIVTTAAAANGWQISSNRPSKFCYPVDITTTATIAGNAEGYILLEVCSSNSTSANAWVSVGKVSNANAVSLAITLQSVQKSGGILCADVPAGWYTRMRSVNVSGTPVYSTTNGWEITK